MNDGETNGPSGLLTAAQFILRALNNVSQRKSIVVNSRHDVTYLGLDFNVTK